MTLQSQTIDPYETDAAWLFSAPSFLMDRVEPAAEHIHLPPRTVRGGEFSFGRGPLPATPDQGRLKRLRSWGATQTIDVPHGNILDLRRNTPSNWAHFLNNHLPIVFHVCDQLDVDPADAMVILPADTPGYILKAAAMFGIETMLTDSPVVGDGLLYDCAPWTGIRPVRHEWARLSAPQAAVDRIDRAGGDTSPRRVFLSRKDTRALQNESAVMDWLEPRGFVKIYPEDLSAEDQMRLFRQAEVVVAVHGAGLAPLLYAQPGGRLTHLVEILHAGHMTDVYRVMSHQIGVNWVGVRGRLKPEYIKDAYDFDTVYKAHSLDSFEIDLDSLQLAFDAVQIP